MICDFGNENCLTQLIQNLKSLEENGVQVRTSQGVKTVHFVWAMVLADNLGLNPADSAKNSEMTQWYHLKKTHNYYAVDVAQNDFEKKTRINEESILNCIPSFHVVENLTVEMMHDFFEGVCIYNLSHIP